MSQDRWRTKDFADTFVAPTSGEIKHYYGDYVRQLFLAGAIFVILSLPLQHNTLALPDVMFYLSLVLALIVFAGLTNPTKQWVLIADVFIATGGVLFFEFLALLAFQDKRWILFVVLQTGVVAFVFALYFAVKTVRAMMLNQVKNIEEERE